MKKYRVKEIFGPTLQGEGEYVGLPVFFLRFANCNKWTGRPEHKPDSICNYCDTDFVGGDLRTADEIIEDLDFLKSQHPDISHLVISGGEPTMQIDMNIIEPLSRIFHIHIETNGSLPIDEEVFDHLFHVTCSPKQPYAETKLKQCHALKFLYPWIHPEINPESFCRDIELLEGEELPEVFIQPVERNGDTPHLQEVIDLCLKNGWRLSQQIHKILNLR